MRTNWVDFNKVVSFFLSSALLPCQAPGGGGVSEGCLGGMAPGLHLPETHSQSYGAGGRGARGGKLLRQVCSWGPAEAPGASKPSACLPPGQPSVSLQRRPLAMALGAVWGLWAAINSAEGRLEGTVGRSVQLAIVCRPCASNSKRCSWEVSSASFLFRSGHFSSARSCKAAPHGGHPREGKGGSSWSSTAAFPAGPGEPDGLSRSPGNVPSDERRLQVRAKRRLALGNSRDKGRTTGKERQPLAQAGRSPGRWQAIRSSAQQHGRVTSSPGGKAEPAQPTVPNLDG